MSENEKLISAIEALAKKIETLKDEKSDGLLTIVELAKRWGVSESVIEQNRQAFDIPFVKIGKLVRYPLEAIKTWEKRNTKRVS
jgi:excisionase family DNA binding protein